MANKKLSRHEIKFSLHGDTTKRVKKTTSEKFFDLKGKELIKNIAKKTGKSERTVRSYYKFLSGQKMDKHDRRPPKEFLDKISKLAKSKKVTSYKQVSSTIKKDQNVKQLDFISKEKKKEFKNLLEKIPAKNYSFTIVRMEIKYFKKHGETFTRWQSLTVPSKNHSEIITQVQDYLNALLFPYIVRAEIISISFNVVGKIENTIQNKKKKGKR